MRFLFICMILFNLGIASSIGSVFDLSGQYTLPSLSIMQDSYYPPLPIPEEAINSTEELNPITFYFANVLFVFFLIRLLLRT